MKRALISALTFFSVIAPASAALATPIAERIDGYHIRAEVEADRMQFENCVDRLNNGETTLQHCVPQWAPPIVVETTTTTTTIAPVVTTPPTTTVPPAPTTTLPPAPTTTSTTTTTTTTVAPAPTTTVAPANPVEDCIADQGICLTHAALAYMDDNWPLMPSGVNPPPYFMFSPGLWDGLCHRSECKYLNGERLYIWRLPDPLSFEDFAAFADVWCPGVAGGEGTGSYGAACNTGHVSGGDYRINYNEGVLGVKWDNSNINPPAGFSTWADWYRTEGHLDY